jgi:hypothetical protein
VVGLVSFLWLSGVGLPRLVLAEMSAPSGRVGELQPRGKQVIPPVDSDDNPQTSPGGVRDDCLVGENPKPLKALVPATAGNVGITVAAYPTLFVYIPETGAEEAEFVLKDVSADSVVYQTRVRLPSTPGVMSLSLPKRADVKELQVQKDYRWTFALVCKSQDGKENTDIFVNGDIQRLNRPDVEKQVREAAPQEVPSIYAKEGIWHDLLASLAKLRRDNPNDAELAEFWARLLSDVGLADVAKEPLVQPFSLIPRGAPPSRRQSPGTR